ncbi:SIMPL domain-containing protein [Qipengyuania gelatinilytica]|uniref:SIMPL domain-containing protein n=1 Tax=Qipengyuania gelatinilytica TaxID=2867231 RepID=A0ABX9A5H1_9SPHN|nr:SIMPL domain-containing protein [Qipengyuania gelatinilytica]QZD96286.1 SIMPL domain-containing protein [Qipengyuania gelatinilytica]
MQKLILAAAAPLVLAACSDRADEARGVDHGETLLSVSASGQAESRPDRAQFNAGVETFSRSATAASEANAEKLAEIVAALREMGVAEDDIQTQNVSVQRITWGDRKGQYQASNVFQVTMDDPDAAGAAITAVTEAGANVLGGPSLTMSDPEAVANLAYADAYKAARTRAEAYAEAAGMEISRVLYIRDAGGQQGNTWLRGAEVMNEAMVQRTAPVAPPPPPIALGPRPESGSPGMMVGTTRSNVYIQVDFALREK